MNPRAVCRRPRLLEHVVALGSSLLEERILGGFAPAPYCAFNIPGGDLPSLWLVHTLVMCSLEARKKSYRRYVSVKLQKVRRGFSSKSLDKTFYLPTTP